MTKKQFTVYGKEIIQGDECWAVAHSEYNADVIATALNELHEEKEDWKHNCLKTESENSILWNEISILREQGAEPSDAFKNYLNNLKNKHKKLQGDVE